MGGARSGRLALGRGALGCSAVQPLDRRCARPERGLAHSRLVGGCHACHRADYRLVARDGRAGGRTPQLRRHSHRGGGRSRRPVKPAAPTGDPPARPTVRGRLRSDAPPARARRPARRGGPWRASASRAWQREQRRPLARGAGRRPMDYRPAQYAARSCAPSRLDVDGGGVVGVGARATGLRG